MTSSAPLPLPRRRHRAALLVVALTTVLGGCVRAAALTNGCDAFEAWAADGAPRDLASPHEGPRYLALLATVQDTAPAVEADARTTLAAAQQVHDAWTAAGGPDGPGDQVERAEAVVDRVWTDEVSAAAADVLAYGVTTCGIEVPS